MGEFLMGALAFLAIGGAISVGTVALLVFGFRKVMKWARQDTLGGNKQLYLDQDTEPDPQDIQRSLRTYLHARGIGTRARAASNQVRAAVEKRNNLTIVIESKFPPGTLSHTKFMSAVDTAYNVLLRNCAIIANRINFFDVRDYQMLERANSSVLPSRTAAPKDIQQERLELMNMSIQTLDNIIAANEKLLLELDKLAIELGTVGLESSETNTNDMLDEIGVLTEQTRYYQ